LFMGGIVGFVMPIMHWTGNYEFGTTQSCYCPEDCNDKNPCRRSARHDELHLHTTPRTRSSRALLGTRSADEICQEGDKPDCAVPIDPDQNAIICFVFAGIVPLTIICCFFLTPLVEGGCCSECFAPFLYAVCCWCQYMRCCENRSDFVFNQQKYDEDTAAHLQRAAAIRESHAQSTSQRIDFAVIMGPNKKLVSVSAYPDNTTQQLCTALHCSEGSLSFASTALSFKNKDGADATLTSHAVMGNSELSCKADSYEEQMCSLKHPAEYELETAAATAPCNRKGAYWHQKETKVWFRCTWCCDDQAKFTGGTKEEYDDSHGRMAVMS